MSKNKVAPKLLFCPDNPIVCTKSLPLNDSTITRCFVESAEEGHVKDTQMREGVNCRMIGELMGEFKGKTTGVRVLSDGKIEISDSGLGTLYGKEAAEMETGVGTLMPNGVTMIEGNSLIMTSEGESVMVKFSGIGWASGKGLKSSYRGASFQMTSSPKLASINKTVGVWEYESDEQGEFSLKIWEWK